MAFHPGGDGPSDNMPAAAQPVDAVTPVDYGINPSDVMLNNLVVNVCSLRTSRHCQLLLMISELEIRSVLDSSRTLAVCCWLPLVALRQMPEDDDHHN